MGALKAASNELSLILGLDENQPTVFLGPFGGGVTKLETNGPIDLYTFEGHAEELEGTLLIEVALAGHPSIRSISANFQRDGDLIHGDIETVGTQGEVISNASWTSQSPNNH